MAKKIFVGNLSFQTTENDLTDLFAQVGAVESVSIITDRDTGRSKGFGFVAMNDDDADKAITRFSGSELNGRSLTVNEARPMVKKDFGGRENGNRGGGRGGYGRY
jgi:cold-inducible RNA-binding protein